MIRARRWISAAHLAALLAAGPSLADDLRDLHFGEALYYITVAYAQLERGILRERVKAGMERARKQGHKIGRPRVMDRRGFKRRFGAVLELLRHGQVSRCQAARELGIGYATLKRLIDAQERTR